MHLTDDNVEHSWNAFAPKWWEQTGEEGDFYHQNFIIPSMLRLLGDVSGRKILDMACGTGIFSRYLAKKGAQVVGIDLSEKMLAKAIELEQKRPLGITYYHGSVAKMNMFDDNSFDAVTCNMGLMDMPDFRAAISEACRVLIAGGRFVFSIFHPCFCTPEAGWEKTDVNSKRNEDKLYWKVDRYFERLSGRGIFCYAVDFYFHRTLGDYLNTLIKIGFIIEKLDESEPTSEQLANDKELEEMKRMAEFLVVAAKKQE